MKTLTLSALVLLLWALPADAGLTRLMLGDVSTRTAGVDRALDKQFRLLAERELAQVTLTRGRERYVLSFALLELSTTATAQRARSSSTVSALLEHQGNLVAVLKGRATVEGDARAARESEVDAMQAALRSALRRVPEAVK